MSLGPFLRTVRLKRSLSQSQLARAIGVDETYISHLERDQRDPSVATIRDLGAALDTDPLEFCRHLLQGEKKK